MSTLSKSADGKNDENAVDRKLYEIRKFMKLAMENNPNVLEMLFVNKENVVFEDAFGQMLLDNAYLFPWKGAKQKFLGYAFGQKHKMQIRTENFSDLNIAYSFLVSAVEETPNKLLAEYRGCLLPGGIDKGDSFTIGDLNFHPSRKIKDVAKMLKSRLDKATNRSGLMEKYGYDTKFASHLIRLMYEGQHILRTGRLIFPLPEADFLRDS